MSNSANLPEVDHIDSNRSNNRLSNLRWVTSAQNRDAACAKAVDQFTLDGTFVQRFASLKEAAAKMRVSYVNISGCCNGKYMTSAGFKWKFSEQIVQN